MRGACGACARAIVAYASVLKNIRGFHLDLNTKKRLFRCIRDFGDELGSFELMPGVCLSVDTLASAEWLRARSYIAAKSAHLESRKDTLGGEPVIIGTRITCRSLLGRFDDGDAFDDLCQDYQNVPRAAFEAAITYARTHLPGERLARTRPRRS